MSKSKIIKKLDQLTSLLDKIDETRVINQDDPETWDSDVLYNLLAQCQEVIQLLEDKTEEKKLDELGLPLIVEEGLLSLIDEYLEDKEENYD